MVPAEVVALRDPVILVVEDEVLIRLSVCDFLRNAGYIVIEAGNGREALAVLKIRSDIALVVTDSAYGGCHGRRRSDPRSAQSIPGHQADSCICLSTTGAAPATRSARGSRPDSAGRCTSIRPRRGRAGNSAPVRLGEGQYATADDDLREGRPHHRRHLPGLQGQAVSQIGATGRRGDAPLRNSGASKREPRRAGAGGAGSRRGRRLKALRGGPRARRRDAGGAIGRNPRARRRERRGKVDARSHFRGRLSTRSGSAHGRRRSQTFGRPPTPMRWESGSSIRSRTSFPTCPSPRICFSATFAASTGCSSTAPISRGARARCWPNSASRTISGPWTRAGDLSPAQRQLMEIMRALRRGLARARAGRADLFLDRGGGAAALPSGAAAGRRRRRRHLYFAPDARSEGSGGSRGGAARRAAGRGTADGGVPRSGNHSGHGRKADRRPL